MTNDLQNPTHKKPLLGLNLQELKELATGLGLPALWAGSWQSGFTKSKCLIFPA